MGCHGGLNVADTLGGSGGSYLDWPQLYSQDQVAMYIANTGFGYGDSASVALSERLLSLFAKNLHSDASSVGEQWAAALQQYFGTAGAYDVYDEKVMEETTFYGLPFWHFGTPATARLHAGHDDRRRGHRQPGQGAELPERRRRPADAVRSLPAEPAALEPGGHVVHACRRAASG